MKELILTENLHINSTLSDLYLYDGIVDIEDNLDHINNIFQTDAQFPGVIIKGQGKLLGVFSRSAFFESLSKPYYLELFNKRPVKFFLEVFQNDHTLVLPSSMTVVEAVKVALERPKDMFDSPIIVEFDNDKLKLMDSYHLILAHSHINTLALKALKEANEFKTDLLSIAAHDLKNPLTSIIGFSQLLLADSKLDTELIDSVNQIQAASKHMHNLILELLNSNVIESGQMTIRKQLIDVNEIINAIIYQSSAQAANKDQTIEFLYNKDDYYIVNGDSLKIRESMENLISNAIKYSPRNSSIIIRLENDGEIITFSVKDEGPGLNEDDLMKLFRKFQRLSALPTGGESSTGLGLYIAKQIVELHKGKIYVKSQPGKGATFFIELLAESLED